MLPIHDENPRLSTPVITLLLIIAAVFVWFVIQGAGAAIPLSQSICELGMIPGELTGRAIGEIVPLGGGHACVIADRPVLHTIVSSMFLHGDWFHLIGNLWFLWLFGDNIEDALGHVGFALFYLVCGVAAAMTQLLVDPGSAVPMVGASGAISGVMGAYAVLYPHVPVRVLTGFFVFWTVFRVPAVFMLGYWFVLQILGGLPQLGAGASGVAFWAHVGGFVAGLAIAAVVRSRWDDR